MAPRTISCLLLVISLLLIGASATEPNQSIPFTYAGSTGPEHWGKLSPACSACSNGKSQSPVDLTQVKSQIIINGSLNSMARMYNPSQATIVNRGFNVALRFTGDAGNLVVDGTSYGLKEAHWHTPSEHRLKGKRHDAELHLVHKSMEGRIAVVAFFYEVGATDRFISQFHREVEKLGKVKGKGGQEDMIPVGEIETKSLAKKANKFFRYNGSLTTPPCSENVLWHVMARPRTLTVDQLASLRTPLQVHCKNNSRPAQPLNGRFIQMYNKATDIPK